MTGIAWRDKGKVYNGKINITFTFYVTRKRHARIASMYLVVIICWLKEGTLMHKTGQ